MALSSPGGPDGPDGPGRVDGADGVECAEVGLAEGPESGLLCWVLAVGGNIAFVSILWRCWWWRRQCWGGQKVV